MKFETNSRFLRGENNKEKGVKCVIQGPKGDEKTLEADICLLSIGRKPYTAGLALEKAGLEANKFGRVDINKKW